MGDVRGGGGGCRYFCDTYSSKAWDILTLSANLSLDILVNYILMKERVYTIKLKESLTFALGEFAHNNKILIPTKESASDGCLGRGGG